MVVVNEPPHIGVSQSAHPMLRELKDEGHFNEMQDAFRMAVALAVAAGVDPPTLGAMQTTFSVSGVDPDQSIKAAVQAVYADHLDGESVYRFVERLADWGVRELHQMSRGGRIDVADLLAKEFQDGR